jgi:hypothetical protein
MKNRTSIAILATLICLVVGCNKSSPPPTASASLSKDESGLIGSWQTVEDSPSIYNFTPDHSLTESYKGNGVIQSASMTGKWRLDGKQLVITRDSETVKNSAGKDQTVHPSGAQATVTWTIESISDSAMTWSTSISRAGVSRTIELSLKRVSSP